MKLAVLLAAAVASVSSFAPSALQQQRSTIRSWSTRTDDTSTGDDFSSFAASLEEEAPTNSNRKNGSNSKTSSDMTWKADLERLLDPTTPVAQRQILLSNLMNADKEIRASVQAALVERKVRERERFCCLLLTGSSLHFFL